MCPRGNLLLGKTAGRNINNLRCVDGTTIMAEIEEELKSLLMKVKEKNEKVVLIRELVMDREAWRAAVHGTTKSRTRLKD